MKTIKRNNKAGVTLIELLIAMSLTVVIMSAGGGFYLSFANMTNDAITSTQAQRNAHIALMHIENNIRNAASEFIINGNILKYRRYAGADIYSGPTIICEYEYNANLGQIVFRNPPNQIIVSNHIYGCSFSKYQDDGIVLQVEITARDNNDNPNSEYTLSTNIEAMNTASPSVFN